MAYWGEEAGPRPQEVEAGARLSGPAPGPVGTGRGSVCWNGFFPLSQWQVGGRPQSRCSCSRQKGIIVARRPAPPAEHCAGSSRSPTKTWARPKQVKGQEGLASDTFWADPWNPGFCGSANGFARSGSVDSPECEALANSVESPPCPRGVLRPPGDPQQTFILGTSRPTEHSHSSPWYVQYLFWIFWILAMKKV